MARGRSQLGVGWILTWPLTLVFAATVFLSARELNRTAVEGGTASIGGPGWTAEFPARIERVTQALERSTLSLPVPSEEQSGSGAVRWTHRTYVTPVNPDDHGKVETVISALQAVDSGLTVSSVVGEGAVELRIGLDGLLTHTVRLQTQVVEPAKPSTPQLAMLVASLGDDLLMARELVGLDAPVALGIRPFRPFSKEVAELAHHFEREVWLDLSVRGTNDLPIDSDAPRAQDVSYLDSALASVPYVVGITQEPGTGWSEGALTAEVRRRKLLYVGLRPVLGSPAPARVPEMVSMTAESSDQLPALSSRAQDHGPVIAVSHAAVTPAVLKDVVPEWRAAGVDLVPVSSLLRAALPPP